LKSATTTCVPTPLWSSISRGLKAILPSVSRLASNHQIPNLWAELVMTSALPTWLTP
jgi:hypothetical protein